MRANERARASGRVRARERVYVRRISEYAGVCVRAFQVDVYKDAQDRGKSYFLALGRLKIDPPHVWDR